MLTPQQFYVNQAWIVIRVNDSFIYVQNEPYDIYMLMDAASAYILGNVISPVVDETPGRDDVETLFHQAWQAKCEWARQLIITEKSKATRMFSKVARKIGMTVHTVDLSELEPIIGPLKESFENDFMRNF